MPLLTSFVMSAVLGLAVLVAPAAPTATEEPVPSPQACAEGGVTVVVDPADLGGDPAVSCVEAGAEQPAPDVFAEAGIELTPVDPFPGAVCQVDGEPADATCGAMPPADAYWGLYVAEAGGEWDFAPVGIDELTVAEGSFVGFAWQSGGDPTAPAVAPQAGEATPGAAAGEADSGDDASGEDAAQQAPDDGGLPWWVPLVVGVAVIALGLGFAWRRRSRT